MAACCLKIIPVYFYKYKLVKLCSQSNCYRYYHCVRRNNCCRKTRKNVNYLSQTTTTYLLPGEIDFFRERFIPINRRTIIRLLLQEPNFLTEDEKKRFEEFALAIDSIIINRYHGLVQELKVLYDPVNPDKDNVTFRKMNRREELDHEFWLLQKLSVVLKRANFHEIPKHIAEEALKRHDSREGVKVSVDPEKYAVLRFWALGREAPPEIIPWFKQAWYKIAPSHQPLPIRFYKRLIVALRLKTRNELTLAAYRDIPVNALEQMLPDSRIKMSRIDKSLLGTSMIIGGTGILATMMSAMLDARVETVLIIAGIMILISFRSWTVYKNRKNTYMVELSKMLYHKSLANNLGLLPYIVDRAEDESFKEALLVYIFVLTQQTVQFRNENKSEQFGDIPVSVLEHHIEEWIHKKVKIQVQFESEESVKFLHSLGILRQTREKLYVDSLETALHSLPPQQQSIFNQEWEHEIVKGYEENYQATAFHEEIKDEKKSKFNWQ